MSKYSIVCTAINTESQPFSGEGTINGKEFEVRTILHATGILWKVAENGFCPAPTAGSNFDRGERSAIAAWMKKVEMNPELVGQNSMYASMTGLAPKRNAVPSPQVQSMATEIEELKALVQALLGQQSAEDSEEEISEE